jgi:hypothetical protein
VLISALLVLVLASEPQRVSEAQAKILIANATGESIGRGGLAELTTSEMWQRMRAQLFQARERDAQRATWLIEDGHARKIGAVTSICIADLDLDGSAELIYTYPHRRNAAVAAYVPKTGLILFGDRVFMDGRWIVDKIDDQNVTLVTADAIERIPLARLTFQAKRFRLQLRPHLPKDVRRRLRH